MRRVRHAVRAALLLLGLAAPLAAQTAENVLLIVNDGSPASVQIGDYYAQRRSLPAAQVLHIKAPIDDEIDRRAYVTSIEAPIASWLVQNAAQDRILYIVLTLGVPLRISGTAGRNGTMASVDSELTLLYRKMFGKTAPLAGRIDNPYFTSGGPPFKRFSHAVADVFLVTRLAGFTVDDVKGLIDRAAAPARSGSVVLDERATEPERVVDQWLERAGESLASATTTQVVLEKTKALATAPSSGVIGYYSWGSSDPAFQTRRVGFEFAPGAIAAMFVATDGRTFKEPPADWNVSRDWNVPAKLFAGSPESLAGDLVREGATGVAAHVAEPFLDAAIRPYILFPAYVDGLNLAEAFYAAMPFLGWQTIVVGDPLCAPFRTTSLSRSEATPDLDPATELPKPFSDRRLDVVMTANHLPRSAASALIRGDMRLLRNDRAGARTAYEEASEGSTDSSTADRTLAMMDETDGDYEAAIRHYRRALRRSANDVISLNNLSYALAVRQDNPQEALPLAERAATLAPREPNVLDTLAWIHHLNGDHAKAEALLDRARRLDPRQAEVWVHSAAVHLAMGDPTTAERDLAEAIRISPDVAERADVLKLQTEIKARKR